ncbi:preprotein translocase SecY subunit [Zymomonas mobilis subsp. mobilis ZM4 = ATCC 31821]|uniref:Protein translocase subunit SecY n=2 Tax=Zymomonas mobilis subsp. mobilis TaxID=120045 RepID=Q5NQ44_ZYMMO|nr:preprotein translocase subunit SecY [Zymomonas mobilis]AAV89161.1 preprotein translocase, SecY subunit [Zymomonas mobilis subsp. mobilis ZM4 = ATCC 31821]ACV75263.1 preprotein translocase, SecY subunit [Zymomonas mobilis subsp. mobilis NCIMB 11163]AEH62898.1 preprotein translocase, SecY subunit [Zymomonas mobilis subsp. mobilis ATCC 10988]AFN56623.1 preprotein translocase, SecY subunit [Zymomonas mobilis subsp. mobilis ATCC 29191]AHB10049.1 protein translocase subunit secY/sec61 alpha [Zymo
MASAANQFASNFNLSQFGKATDLKKRLWFTFLALIVFRLLSFVPLPGIDPRTMGALFAQTHGGVLDFFNTFSGGSLSRMSLIALGLMPYITASIVVQLSTSLSPHLEALKKEGESGRKKLNQYTRYGTVLLTAIQGYFIAVGLENWKTPAGLSAVVDPGLLFRISCVISLIGGTMFLMWLGEQITSRGVGNGTSLIIMAGIVSQLPVIILNTLERTRSGAVNPALIIAVIAVVAALVLFICFMERAQRRVLIQYPKRQSANGMMQADKSHLPLKLNTANVIPPIFASSVLLMPLTITQFAGQRVTAGGRWSNILITLNQYLAHGTWLYMLLYGIGIVFFSFFYTAIVFNPEETADNLKRYGGFIPGIRPGKATADYLDYLLTRITVIGAAYLTCICLVPEFMASELGMTSFAIGGTSLLIVVNVTIDTVTQIQSHLIAHQYGDLIRKSKLRGKSIRRRQRLK